MFKIKRLRPTIILGLVLVIASFTIYALQIVLFNSARDTIFYFLQDTAFVPLQVIIVTLILDNILSKREKQERLRKINIVISAFYSEIGTPLLSILSCFSIDISRLKKMLEIKGDWVNADFKSSARSLQGCDFIIESNVNDLILLNDYLLNKRSYIIAMFQNPILLEHDTFTDMLWAVYHISDELSSRETLKGLPTTDLEHLSNDIKRAFKLLIIEWIFYMNHLRREYPYLYSLALRKNPFISNDVIVGE